MGAELSVVIVSFNTRNLLERCLDSLPAGAAGRSLQAIVVDNGSCDGSPALVRAKFPDVVLLEAGANLGFGVATNLGTRRAVGRWVAWLNSDCEAGPGSLDALCGYLETHERVGAVGPLLVHPDGRVQPSAQAFPTSARLAWHFLGLRRLARAPGLRRLIRGAGRSAGPFVRGYLEALDPGEEPRAVDWISGACIVTRAVVIERVGMFDETFFMYSEDTDWCHRVRTAGYEIHQAPGARIVHRVGASRTHNPMATVHYYRSLYVYFRRHRPRSMVAVRLLMGAGALLYGAAHAVRSAMARRREANPWWPVLRICWRDDARLEGAA